VGVALGRGGPRAAGVEPEGTDPQGEPGGRN
jgi:hypothetical protein